MKILLLEDDILLNKSIAKYLKTEGHDIDTFRNGSVALDSLQETLYDLLILDINVPGIDGMTLMQRLQDGQKHIPTIIISALKEIEDISKAFNLGCEDYLKKPFHLKELSIRIDKILQSGYTPTSHVRLSQNYSFDLVNSILTFKGETQALSLRQLKIINILALNRGNFVNYDLFDECAWDDVEDVTPPTIRTEINRLKKVLKEDIITNVRNVGYCIKRPS